ncbi:protocatechuate 3,4-dioxygenase subunit alpha [Ancylobacter polymorphus]|uniref:Protocatechuate 3,4-dioxygenase alpha subunit n=1 Tax=Ancylobacter polymorphus TaxID=223390 RepID=A0ABU0BGQ4_9HYPH|nr:protocatechuate 3,4-dioxygenase subunit alpha [Ancylobacter polymorphus]MDQ0304971.1 protocatechuate 3,4-dioxygenase alpha subunit [Ancylobacter polymorphus]
MLNQLRPYRESASQTAGPYVHIGCTPNQAEITGVWAEDLGARMLQPQTKGERIVVEGIVYDGSGAPLKDAVIEIWQADAAGLYAGPGESRGAADPAFPGFGRQATDGDTGLFRFETIKPGRVPYDDGRLQAPHISVWIVARGINIGLSTRLYFADEAEANAADPVLLRVLDPRRRGTLIAAPAPGAEPGVYRFDIRLQGPDETVFFDI